MLSFRTRLALAHQAAIVAVLAVTALSAYLWLTSALHGQLDAALIALAETEAALLVEDAPVVRIHEAPPGTAALSYERLDRLLQIDDADGRPLSRSANLGTAHLPMPPDLLARVAAGETVFVTLKHFGGEPTRMLLLPVRVQGTLRVVQAAGSLDDLNHVVQSAGVLFIVAGMALLLAVGFAGELLTRRMLRAIDDVVQQARRIGSNSISDRRLPHPGTSDELGRLVETLNAMLTRLEQGMEAQRRFTADASHELRSPLSRVRAEVEITLRRPRGIEEYVDALRSVLEDVERLTLLVEELLALARVDAGQERGLGETVLLNAVVEEAVARIRPIAEQKRVAFVLEAAPALRVAASQGAVKLVLANLLDNALKFSPEGGRVTVRLAQAEADALLTVQDAGPGISTTDMPYLFHRFYRGSAARASGIPGVGLGLALSQSIAEAQGGRIEAANPPQGGALFSVRFPLAVSSTDSRVDSIGGTADGAAGL